MLRPVAFTNLHCKTNRKITQNPPFCPAQDPDTAWYTKMDSCLTPLLEVSGSEEIAGGELAKWPRRLNEVPPPRITRGPVEGVTAEVFQEDNELWKRKVSYYKTVNNQLGKTGRYRNLLDMNAYLGKYIVVILHSSTDVRPLNTDDFKYAHEQAHVLLHMLRSSPQCWSLPSKHGEVDQIMPFTDLESHIAESYKMVSALYGPFKSKATKQTPKNALKGLLRNVTLIPCRALSLPVLGENKSLLAQVLDLMFSGTQERLE